MIREDSELRFYLDLAKTLILLGIAYAIHR